MEGSLWWILTGLAIATRVVDVVVMDNWMSGRLASMVDRRYLWVSRVGFRKLPKKIANSISFKLIAV